MSNFLKSSTISFQPAVLMGVLYNLQHVEDSFKWSTEYDSQTTDILWTRSLGSLGHFNSSNVSGNAMWFNWPRQDSGSRSCLIISGVTRDLNGAILPNCAVECFTAADNVIQSSVLSSNSGLFSLPTYASESHYLVAYKASSPSNLAGSSDQNITGI